MWARETQNEASELTRTLNLMSLFLFPFQGRVQTLYSSLSDSNSLCEKKRYLNLGYWDKGVSNLDSAADAMADLLAVQSRLGQADHVLDVGCGFGDQDFYWMNKYAPAKITAINITA